MIQTSPSPVVVFLNRMSGRPSPLKSATPQIDQYVGTTPSDTLEEKAVPFISQITRSPVAVLVQRMSG